MIGATDLLLRERISSEEALRVMLGVVQPEHASRKGIQDYARTQVLDELQRRKITVEDYVGRFKNQVIREEYRKMLEGEREINEDFLEVLTCNFMLLDKLIPTDPSVTLEDYRQIHERVFQHPFSEKGLHPSHYMEFWLADLCFS